MPPPDSLVAFDILIRRSLTAVVWGSTIVLAVLAVRWAARNYEDSKARARERQREKWAAPGRMTGTDQEAPETGSGLPVGREVPGYGGEWD